MTKQTLLHTKEAQLKQIEDRQRRKKEEEQLESMWNEYSRNIKTLEVSYRTYKKMSYILKDNGKYCFLNY